MMAAVLRAFLLMVVALCAAAAWLLSGRIGWPWAILSSLFLPLLVHALVMAFGFAMAIARARRAAAPPPLAGWLRALPGEIAISLRNMYADIPWRASWPARLPASSRGAVLLVHGYGCNRGIWRGMDSWLAARGWAVDALDLEPPHAGIDDFGAQVAAAARRLCTQSGHASVVVLAHSMGGLAARAALRGSPSAPIVHVITIGTPHHGTWHARFGRGVCATQMQPQCVWIQDLLAGEPPGAPARFTCIASRHDNIVSPVSCALLDGARQLIRSGVGHMALLSDREVRAYIECRLEEIGATA